MKTKIMWWEEAVGTYRREKRWIKYTWMKKSYVIYWRKWEDNLNRLCTEIREKNVDWIHVAQDWRKKGAIEVTVINYLIAWNVGNFLTSWKSVCTIAWSSWILILVRYIRLIFTLLFTNWLDEIRRKKYHRKFYRVGLKCISPALIKIKYQNQRRNYTPCRLFHYRGVFLFTKEGLENDLNELHIIFYDGVLISP